MVVCNKNKTKKRQERRRNRKRKKTGTRSLTASSRHKHSATELPWTMYVYTLVYETYKLKMRNMKRKTVIKKQCSVNT
jgi:hypothetical protein